MRISKYTSYNELTKSCAANRLGIENIPNSEQIKNLIYICETLFDTLRSHFNVPIGISSAFRSTKLNKSLGGSKRSQHRNGQALDIDADIYGGITNKEIGDYIKDNLEFDQLIYEFWDDRMQDYKWIHVSLKKSNNRGEIMKSYKQNKKTKYEYTN